MSAATKDFLAILHADLAKALSEKIKNGEATAADMAVARQFLKDNGIEAMATPGSHMKNLNDTVGGEALPEFAEDPEEAYIQ